MAIPLRYKSLQRSGVTGRRSYNTRDLIDPFLTMARPQLPPEPSQVVDEQPLPISYVPKNTYDPNGEVENWSAPGLPTPEKDLADSWGDFAKAHTPVALMAGLGMAASTVVPGLTPALGAAHGIINYAKGKAIKTGAKAAKKYLIDPALAKLGLGGKSEQGRTLGEEGGYIGAGSTGARGSFLETPEPNFGGSFNVPDVSSGGAGVESSIEGFGGIGNTELGAGGDYIGAGSTGARGSFLGQPGPDFGGSFDVDFDVDFDMDGDDIGTGDSPGTGSD